jgi:hypothetical protein
MEKENYPIYSVLQADTFGMPINGAVYYAVKLTIINESTKEIEQIVMIDEELGCTVDDIEDDVIMLALDGKYTLNEDENLCLHCFLEAEKHENAHTIPVMVMEHTPNEEELMDLIQRKGVSNEHELNFILEVDMKEGIYKERPN